MGDTTGNQTRSTSIPGIERATGRPWAEWVGVFERAGAAQLAHPEIARIARAAVPAELANPDWWAQGIAIAYEQHAGLRVPGQSSTGTFRVSASRTLTADRDVAIDAWAAGPGSADSHLGHAVENVRRARTEKRTFWRAGLVGAGKLEVSAVQKDTDRIVLAVSQEGLVTPDRIEEWRSYWKSLLAEL